MKTLPIWILNLFIWTSPLWTQSPTPPSPPNAGAPQLSTSQRIAIQSLEKQKQDGLQMYQQAQQQEASVIQEFTAEHPGWHFNIMTGAVEKDQAPPAPPAPTAKK